MLVLIAQLNLLTSDPEDLQAAFDLMEGEGFYKQSMNPPRWADVFADNLKNAIDWLTGKGCWDYRESDEMPIGFACIYGRGGGHRYFVRPDGRLDYSLHHGRSKGADAESLGFHCM